MSVRPIIAIDGPAGTGKSTVSRGVAAALGCEHLDTGAMYRAATVAAMNAGIDLHDGAAVRDCVAAAEIHVGDVVIANGRNVTEAIRTPEVTAAVSIVAAQPDVRAELIARQRAWVAERGCGVVEGRDITSVVLPDAPVRVYLYAAPEVRAQRRGADEAAANRARAEASIAGELAQRDASDTSLGRVVRPDQVPDGVTVIDTTQQPAEAVIAEIVGMYRALEPTE